MNVTSQCIKNLQLEQGKQTGLFCSSDLDLNMMTLTDEYDLEIPKSVPAHQK